MALPQLDNDDLVNSIEGILHSFIDNYLNFYIVFNFENSLEPFDKDIEQKAVVFFSLSNKGTIDKAITVDSNGQKADRIQFNYNVFVLVNDEVSPNEETKRVLHRKSQKLVDAFDNHKKELKEFDKLDMSYAIGNSINAPKSIKVNKHTLSFIVKKLL